MRLRFKLLSNCGKQNQRHDAARHEREQVNKTPKRKTRSPWARVGRWYKPFSWPYTKRGSARSCTLLEHGGQAGTCFGMLHKLVQLRCGVLFCVNQVVLVSQAGVCPNANENTALGPRLATTTHQQSTTKKAQTPKHSIKHNRVNCIIINQLRGWIGFLWKTWRLVSKPSRASYSATWRGVTSREIRTHGGQ